LLRIFLYEVGPHQCLYGIFEGVISKLEVTEVFDLRLNRLQKPNPQWGLREKVSIGKQKSIAESIGMTMTYQRHESSTQTRKHGQAATKHPSQAPCFHYSASHWG
jgi:hypothetical protein